MDGLIVVNKERGFTSFDVVAKLRGILGEKKIGHLGTLDPEAEGVLPVCLGRATKLSELLSGGEKVYLTRLLLGIRTDSQDASGRFLKREAVPEDEESVRQAILSFTGEQDQLPPMVSAKKVDGQKLVDLARKGKEVSRKPARITVYSIEILKMSLPRVRMRIRCSKGTYIRTLCRDIGEKLGCGGIMESLVREEASGFTLNEALRPDEIASLYLTGNIGRVLRSPEAVLSALPSFHCDPEADLKAANGNVLSADQGAFSAAGTARGSTAVYLSDGTLIGVYRLSEDGRKLKPEVMLGPSDSGARRSARSSIVSIGKFDGVHLGHQKIIGEMIRQGEEKHLATTLFSFTNPPEILTDGRKEAVITPDDEKRRIVKSLGVRRLVEARFTPEMRDMSALDFLEKVLIGHLGMKSIVVGPDCCFGKGREGSVDFLLSHAASYGYDVNVVDKVRMGGEIVSSSRIRDVILSGNMEEAAGLLGRPFRFHGRVAYGAYLGNRIGFPTANLEIAEKKLCPPYGVYLCRVSSGGESWNGMANLGIKPTVNSRLSPNLEIHLFAFSGDLYGKEIEVSLLHFLRHEKRFDSLEALKEQLKKDRAEAERLFQACPVP